MAELLRVDIEQLAIFEKTITDTATKLSELSAQLDNRMAELQKDWNTPAGKNFFAEKKYDWSKELEAYIQVLTTLQNMISAVRQEYQELKDFAEIIHYQ